MGLILLLDVTQYLNVILGSVAVGLGVPGTALPLVLGVDRILDMIRTSVNVTGDLTCSAVIARSEGESLMVTEASA